MEEIRRKRKRTRAWPKGVFSFLTRMKLSDTAAVSFTPCVWFQVV